MVGCKIVIGLILAFLFGWMPLFKSEIADPEFSLPSAIILSLSFWIIVFFEIIEGRYASAGEHDKKRKIIFSKLVISALCLTWFLHVFGNINGPFFVLYLLLLLETALSLSPKFIWSMSLAMVVATSLEFGFLVMGREPSLTLYAGMEFAIRLFSLFLVSIYAVRLVEKTLAVEKAEYQVQRSEERLDSVTKNLKITNNKLEELSKLKDEFVSVASHELRAPLTTIKGYLSMILDGDVGKVSEKVKEYLDNVYKSSERMIRLVNNMLNVSRIESGRLIMSLEDIQIEEAIGEVVDNFSLEAEGHGLELKYFKPKVKTPRVRVDPDRIREVVANLIGNAISFTSHGYIYVRSKLEDNNVIISVEDTGVGIAPADQGGLFRKFSQVGVNAPMKKGSGLGLYICRMLINEFGGEIWLKSKVGKGTTFFFSLPAIRNHNNKEVD